VGVLKIPVEIWNWCTDQIKFYPLRKATLDEELMLIRTQYLGAGGDRASDPAGVIGGGFASSPVAVKFELMEAQMHDPYLRYLTRCVNRLEDATFGLEPTQRDVLEAIWAQGWRDNGTLARVTDCSPATVKRVKRELVERLAIRWGLW